MIYRVTYDEIHEQKKKFYDSHTEASRQVRERPPVDISRIGKIWNSLIDLQNGEDIDDYVIGDNNKIERYIVPLLPPPARLLFFGTGTGREMSVAKSIGYEAYGTTFGKSNPKFAKQMVGEEVLFVDSCTTPWEDESFDVIAAFQVFEHCHSPYFFLAECNRLLRPGGVIILEWPAMFVKLPDGRIENLMYEDNPNNLHHFCCWTPAQAVSMVHKCGFGGARVFGQAVVENSPPFDRIEITRDNDQYYSNFGDTETFLVAFKKSSGEQPPFIQKIRQ